MNNTYAMEQPVVTPPDTLMASTASTPSRVAIGKAKGATGTVIMNGIISGEEYNRTLTGKAGAILYDKMRNSDATVGALLEGIKQPLIGADWYIQPGGKEAQDEEIAEAVKTTLFERLDWPTLLYEILTGLDFGHWVGEKVYVYDDVNGKKLITLDAIESRKQSTIYAWETDDGKPGITQQTYKEKFNIERPRLVVFSFRKEGDNWEGRSLLRRAYKHWDIKTKLELIQAVGLERQGVGVIFIKHPAKYAKEEMDAAIEAARQLRANEEAYVQVPEGWEIGFMDMAADKVMDPNAAIAYHDRQILMSGLLAFLTIGSQSSSGSYSASEVFEGLFQQCEENLATQIERLIFKDVIKQFVDLNWTVKDYPKLRHGKISKDNIAVLAEAMSKLSAAGFLTKGAEIEEHSRKVLHLPEMPEDLKENYDTHPSRQPQEITILDPKTGLPMKQGQQPGAKPQNKVDPKEVKNEPEPKPKVKAQALIERAEVLFADIVEEQELHAAAA